jgi:tRNA dimethylallyltransferase
MAEHSAFFLVGPTAAGKSAVAQHLAETGGLDIISADSMMVYRGLDIGTAKPSPADRAKVRYWCMDVVRPGDRFSVGDFRRLAEAALSDIAAHGRRVIVVGGTGLFIKSLTDGLRPLPASNPERCAYWERVLAAEGPDRLLQILRAKSPALLDSLRDPRNPRRLIRALELAERGVTRSDVSWRRPSPRVIGLALPMDVLTTRIRSRVVEMYRRGLLDEARRLMQEGLQTSPTALQAIGYAEAIACLRGECSREDAMERTILRTRQLAKRQFTWFRHQANVKWVEVAADTPVTEAAARVKELWNACGPTPIAP